MKTSIKTDLNWLAISLALLCSTIVMAEKTQTIDNYLTEHHFKKDQTVPLIFTIHRI